MAKLPGSFCDRQRYLCQGSADTNGINRPSKTAMRLSTFISENHEAIFKDWLDFAATLVPALQTMDRDEVLDHLEHILRAIEIDLDTPETSDERSRKSKGFLTRPAWVSAATEHGTERFASNFSLNATLAEFRALRATVTRLWQEALKNQPRKDTDGEDMIRFNEAIDQALTESTFGFTAAKEQNSRMFNAILSVTPDLACAFDPEGRFMYVNRAMSELLELPSNKIVGKRIGELVMPCGAVMQHDIEHVISTKEISRGELTLTAASGAELVYEYVCVHVLDNMGALESVACTARNITDRKAREEHYFEKANYDALTGLPNRSLFSDRLKQNFSLARRSGKQFALLFIDLDGFKEANDMFGHDAGDLVLQHVSERIQACVRESDTVARLGGDEFTVIIQDVSDADHARTVAESILKDLASPITIYKFTVHISASIGIALFSPDDVTPEVMLKKADSAMYAAKKSGRNRLAFFTPDQEKATWQNCVGRDLRSGVKDRRNQTIKVGDISA